MQRGRAPAHVTTERLTTAQLDRLMEEDAFRVIDDIRSDFNTHDELPRPRDDLASSRGYSHDEARDQRMDSLERAILTLTVKMDSMLENRTSTPTFQNGGRPPVPQDRDVYVRAHMDRERLEIPNQDGKAMAGDIFTHKLIPKPHMFIDRLEGKTMKQKQEYRGNMTRMEYINGFVSMLCDPRARADIDFVRQFEHLRDVTEDCVTCTWQSVHQWSCLIFDLVEKGRISWSDSQLIQNYRMRYTVRENNTRASSPECTDTSDSGHKDIPCPDFNAGTCRVGGIRRHHSAQGVKFSHVCSYCLVADNVRADTHGAAVCRKRHRVATTMANVNVQSLPQHVQGPYQHPNAPGRARPYSQYQPPAVQAPPQTTQQLVVPKDL